MDTTERLIAEDCAKMISHVASRHTEPGSISVLHEVRTLECLKFSQTCLVCLLL